MDTTAVVTQVDSVGTSVLAVGTAIIGVAALSMTVRWVKATFF